MGSLLFTVSINDWDEGIMSTISKFVDDCWMLLRRIQSGLGDMPTGDVNGQRYGGWNIKRKN